MTRFAQRTSFPFLVLSWVCLATLFADAGNLDDIFASGTVYHDDEDVAAYSGQAPHSQPAAPSKGAGGTSGHPQAIVFDLDSPSLAAEDAPLVVFSEQLTTIESLADYHHVVSRDLLHIQLHTLLI